MALGELGASALNGSDKMKYIRYIVIGLVVLITMIPVASAEEVFHWTGDAFSVNGDIVTTDPVPAGSVCTITAYETWWYNYPAWLRADAQCYQTEQDGGYIPAPDGHSFLQFGTGKPQDVYWGPCATDHEYTKTYLGDGKPLNFRIKDWIDGVGNNDCHIPIHITCDDSVGGCWITGGGRIVNGDGTYDSYGGNAMTMKDGTVRGEWNHVNHVGRVDENHFKGDVFWIECSKISDQGPDVPKAIPNYAIFGGSGTYDGVGGYTFRVDWVDSNEGGRSWDRYQLTIYDSEGNVFDVENGEGNSKCKPQAMGTLGCTLDGNLQIHPPNQGHP
jgi:hypothetical protein